MRLSRRFFGILLMAGPPLAGSAFPYAPPGFAARIEGSDAPVSVRRIRDPKNDNLAIVLPDGRRYWTRYVLQNLLRPDEPPRPRETIPIGPGRVRYGPTGCTSRGSP